MSESTKVFGKSVLLQFEDFGNSTAFELLEKSRDRYNTFNDDIQGTACVALAGIIASLRVEGTKDRLCDHRILFLGAGEAGTGIGSLIAYAIAKEDGISIEEARKNIWFTDSKGLITEARAKATKLSHHKAPWAHDASSLKGDLSKFEQVVKALNPTMICGVAAQQSAFTKSILNHMADVNDRPVVFALSNPTTKCKCTAEEAYKWTDGKCVFASGSPFKPVTLNGTTYEPGQGNNAYVFPGIGLGVIAAQAKKIPEDIFYSAAKCLASQVTDADLARGSLYPPLEDIQQVSFKIACQVANDVFDLGVGRTKKPADIEALVRDSQFQE